MLVWCSWCQSFRGERAPYDDLSVTHAVCEDCEPALVEAQVCEHTKHIDAFLKRVRLNFHSLDAAVVPALVEEGLALGMRPLDFAIGILQPLLYELGRSWERGTISIADEHRFTARASGALDELRSRLIGPGRATSATPCVLLLPAAGNEHVLGLRILEIALLAGSVPVHVADAGASTAAAVELVRRMQPQVIGVSISLLPQLTAVREFAVALAREGLNQRARLVVGGRLIWQGLDLRTIPEVQAVAGPLDFLSMLENYPGEGGRP